ncbi:hypothetical protein L1999_13485 [Neobacillus drentensis]|uniref:hypothetical protein n=1 Tax=Neobacillus drentensis TaxID=220684 RepID=UPI001F1A2D63|nr:hypothetical protein [Neobacillus drentensis]ULT59468.1 hypothetical protein L1999_13485 [Neobacillus drentensis]
MKFIIYPISALIIGISIIVGASILKGTFFTNQNDSIVKNSSTSISTVNSQDIMTKKQLAEYLQVNEETIDSILNFGMLEDGSYFRSFYSSEKSNANYL